MRLRTVFRIWTRRLAEWWAPRPCTTRVVEFDLRPGGRGLMVLRGPDGTEMPHDGVFLEIVPNRKTVLSDASPAGWIPQDVFMVATFTIAPESSGTRCTARARHRSEEALKRHEAMGFHQGWGTVAGQLAELAEAKA